MIYIMRHGQSSIDIEHRINYRRRTGVLTPTGREQVVQAAQWLADRHIDRIYTSPYEYAHASAWLVGDILGVVPQADENLREIDTGIELEGRIDETAWQIYRTLFTRWQRGDWHVAFPEGESLSQAYERMLQVVIRASTTPNTLIVTHGNLMRCVLPAMCVNAAALQRVDIPDHGAFIILSLYETGGFACESWNLTEHLD